MVRVLRPTSSTCPSGPCRISTAAASQASRCAVAAETWMPPASSSAACRFAARLPVRSGRRGPGQRVCVLCCGRLRCGGRDVPAGTSAPSASVAASTCTTTWYRSPAVPPSRPPARARSANVPNASACRWPKLGATPAASSTGSGSPGSREAPARRSASSAASSARRTTAPTSGVSRPRITTIPSSSTQVCSTRLAWRHRSSAASAVRSTRRQARTTCSTCAAVPASATSSSVCSVSGVATRVTARTFE